jgi:transmembrane sensor
MRFDGATEKTTQEQAIGWVIRLREAGEEDWDAFTAWLEADPDHAAAYDEAALADADAAHLPAERQVEQPHAPVAPQGPDPAPSRRRFIRWAAAATILLSAGYVALGTGGSAYEVATGTGERRVIALEDGSRIELNGGSRLLLDRERARYARLERGEALFKVVHDERRPFEVEAGDTLLRDMGTVFNVVAVSGRLEVAVSEGAVLYDPAGQAERLTPGMALRREGRDKPRISSVSTNAVGGWREGRLIYSAAPVGAVAADLSRNLGVRVVAEEAVASRPFSGVILLAGPSREVLERSAALLGLRLEQSSEGWRLTGTSAAR